MCDRRWKTIRPGREDSISSLQFVPCDSLEKVSLLAVFDPHTMSIMKSFGKLLQVMALILLPLSMFMEMTGGLGRRFGVSDMVVMLVFGIAAFCVGRFVEGYARE